MTVAELRKRVDDQLSFPKTQRTPRHLFEEVLRVIAHGSGSYGNAKALAAEVLRVVE